MRSAGPASACLARIEPDRQAGSARKRAPDGTITTFDPRGSTDTFPTGIDDKGAVTGYYYDSSSVVHGFVMTAAGKTKTFYPAGSTYTRPEGIAPGVAAGWYNDASGIAHGFVRTR